MGLAVIVVLIAASGLYQSITPEHAALVGAYAAAATSGTRSATYTLVLTKDYGASLQMAVAGDATPPAVERGSWVRAGSKVEVALASTGEQMTSTALTLSVTDAGLVVENNAAGSRFAGLTFVRTSGQQQIAN